MIIVNENKIDKKVLIACILLTIIVIAIVVIYIIGNKKEVVIEHKDYQEFTEATAKNYPDEVVVTYQMNSCGETVDNKYTEIYDRTLNIYYDISSHCGVCAPEEYEDTFKVNGKEYDKIKIYYKMNDNSNNCGAVAYKPIIYLYPEEDMNINISFKDPSKLTTSYPKYVNGWSVLARPDGTITYNNKEYYALYYEANNSIKFKEEEDGFVVAKSDLIPFLEEKLSILGLNEREANEFIVYWLPILEENEYNYIRFATSSEVENNIPLEINPAPETLIRVLMTYKGVDKNTQVKEQVLENRVRTGYTVVEWGGTKID